MKLGCLLVVVVVDDIVVVVVVDDIVVVVVVVAVVLLVVIAVVLIDLGSAALLSLFLHFDIKLPLSLTTTVGLDLLTRIT